MEGRRRQRALAETEKEPLASPVLPFGGASCAATYPCVAASARRWSSKRDEGTLRPAPALDRGDGVAPEHPRVLVAGDRHGHGPVAPARTMFCKPERGRSWKIGPARPASRHQSRSDVSATGPPPRWWLRCLVRPGVGGLTPCAPHPCNARITGLLQALRVWSVAMPDTPAPASPPRRSPRTWRPASCRRRRRARRG